MSTDTLSIWSLGAVAHRSPPKRLESIDLVRGLAMVVMMLDHTRDFMHSGAFLFDPTDVARTTPAIFFTRWITHFCAPIFFFLAGTGVYLRGLRGASSTNQTRVLLTRGLWMIVLEFTVVRLGAHFNLNLDRYLLAQTLWALGWSMIALAAIVHAPLRVVAVFGLILMLGHDAFDGLTVPAWEAGQSMPSIWSRVAMILHQPGEFPLWRGGPLFIVLYPLIPWIGVMAAGYAFGVLYTIDTARRWRIMLWLGAAATLLFEVLRATNVYGDPYPWTKQPTVALTLLAVLDVNKYPPSLSFLCMTLGPSILLLAVAEATSRGPLGRVLVTFGRVPLFFYLLQWFVAHLIALGTWAVFGKDTSLLFFDLTSPPAEVTSGAFGFSLPVVYAAWLLGVALLYPVCAWYARLKRRHHDSWLQYM